MHGFVCDEMHQNSFGPHAYQSKWYWTKIYLWFKHSSDNYSGQIMSKGGNVLAHSYRRTNYKKMQKYHIFKCKKYLEKVPVDMWTFYVHTQSFGKKDHLGGMCKKTKNVA
jgi:hypothetical protein